MADNKTPQPKDTNKVMTDEYNKGASIQSLADKYEKTTEEVEAIVTKG